MNTFYRILWWVAYCIAALFLQQQVSGLDALTPGFLIALQEKSVRQTLWLFLVFTLFQEGTGSLGFGMAFLWYGGQVVLFQLSARLFVADNILFVTVLSASLGLYYSALLWLMCAIQDIPMDYSTLLHQGIVQMIATPIIWGIAYSLRPRGASHAH